MVAKHLGATLVLPDIRGSKPGDERLVLFLYVHDFFLVCYFVSLKVLKLMNSLFYQEF